MTDILVQPVQTWSVVIDSEGHPEHDPGTTYSVVASGLSHDDAWEMVAQIEHEADAALDDCGCDDVSEVDGEVRHTCSGYPMVTAFACLDDRIDRYLSAGREA